MPVAPRIIPREPSNEKSSRKHRCLAEAISPRCDKVFEEHTNSHELLTRIDALDEIRRRILPIPSEWRRSIQSKSGDCITRRLSDVAAEVVTWTWNNRILRGKLNIFYGDPGRGKTWTVLDIIAHVTTGRPFCDGAPCTRGEALFVTAEDGIADTIRPRLELLGADLTRVHCLDLVREKEREVALDLERHLENVNAWLMEHPHVRLVALDPLAAFLGKIDSHRNNEVRGLLGKVAKLAENRGVAILAIDHLVKASGGKAVHRGIGSIAFTAAARSVWQVVDDPDDPGRRMFLPVKCNLAKNPTGLAFRITDNGLAWEKGAVTISADDIAAEAGETPRGEAKAWLRDFLKKGPVAASDVERQARKDGICLRTLKYAKKELGIESSRSNGVWAWGFPKRVKP